MSYWEERALQLEKANFKQSDKFVEFMADQYNQAMDEMNKRIYNHLRDMADMNDITLAEAKRYMNSDELKIWKTSLEEYIEKSQGDISESLDRELRSISKRVRVSRLQAMETDLKLIVDKLINEEHKAAYNTLVGGYNHAYYGVVYDLQKITGYEVIEAVDIKKLEVLVNKPWVSDGLNFSERIWGKKSRLINELHKGLTQQLIGGTSINELSKRLQKEFDVSEYQAKRLIRTEMSAVRAQATKDGYGEIGVEQYQILATLDLRTSEICRSLDGKIFGMKDYQVGITAPPFHVGCRTTTIPYIEGLTDDGVRMTRDPITGKAIEVDGSLNYNEWYDKYVKPSDEEYKEFVNDADVFNWRRDEIYRYTSSLTEEETSIIKNYTNSSYTRINSALRKNNIEPELQRSINILDEALTKFELNDNIIVYRGTSVQHLKGMFDFKVPEDLIGQKYLEKGYMSTSLLEETSFSRDVKFKIRVGKGHAGAYIDDISVYSGEEFEFLIKRNSEFNILDAKYVIDDYSQKILCVEMELIK